MPSLLVWAVVVALVLPLAGWAGGAFLRSRSAVWTSAIRLVLGVAISAAVVLWIAADAYRRWFASLVVTAWKVFLTVDTDMPVPSCGQSIVSEPAGATSYASVRNPDPIQNPNFGWFSFGPMSRARFQCDEGGSTRGNDDRVCSLVLVIDRERSPRGSEARSIVRVSLATIR